MYKETFSIWLENSVHDHKISNLIKQYALNKRDIFFPHITLVTNISTKEKSLSLLNKIPKYKYNVVLNKLSIGDSYFQKLYLEPLDPSFFNNAVEKLEGWPSLWIPHLSIFYGNELPENFNFEIVKTMLPLSITFDTISIYKTGPIISDWEKIISKNLK